jgi:serine/threonine protein kinase
LAMEKYCPVCGNRFPADTTLCPDDSAALVPVPQEDLIGQVVDRRYHVLEVIGRGGMGVVYRAEHQILKRAVALKIVRTDMVQDETSVKRFLNEARAIASLENPHTVTIFDSGVTEDGTLYYTMELLTGKPLSAILRERHSLAYPRAVDLVRQVCQSLQEAHQKGIVHRDIKPDNIFVTQVDQRDFVKLVDFGIAKVLDDPVGDGPQTRTGMLCGTPRYLSPEQVSGARPGPPTDLYALGVVLYEMLAGTPPFSGPTPAQLMHQHLREAPPPIPQGNPNAGIPPELNSVLLKSLEKDPAHRYTSAVDFSLALEGAVGALSGTDATLTDTPFSADLTGLATPTPLAPLPSQHQADQTLEAPSFSDPPPDLDAKTQTAHLSAQPSGSTTLPTAAAETEQMTFGASDDTVASPATVAAPASRSGLLPGLFGGAAIAVGVAMLVLWLTGWRPGQETPGPGGAGSQEKVEHDGQAALPTPTNDVTPAPDHSVEAVQSVARDLPAPPDVFAQPQADIQPDHSDELPQVRDAGLDSLDLDRRDVTKETNEPAPVDAAAMKDSNVVTKPPVKTPVRRRDPRRKDPHKKPRSDDWFQGVEALPE